MLLLYFTWIVFLYKPRIINYNMGVEYIITCKALLIKIKRLGIWKKCDLDVILMNRDQLCKSLDRTDYLSVTNLP